MQVLGSIVGMQAFWVHKGYLEEYFEANQFFPIFYLIKLPFHNLLKTESAAGVCVYFLTQLQ